MKKFILAGASQPAYYRGAETPISSNQDSYRSFIGDKLIVGCVSDGCSKCSDSGIGAALLTKVLIKAVRQYESFIERHQTNVFLAQVELELLNFIRSVSSSLGGPILDTISDYFSATVVFFVVREDKYLVAACGDGYISVNGLVQDLADEEDREENLPPFLVYRQFPKIVEDSRFDRSGLRIITGGMTSTLKELIICTDGAGPIVNTPFLSAEDSLPGMLLSPSHFFRKGIGYPKHLNDDPDLGLALQLKHSAKHFEDDVTILGLIRRGSAS